MSDFHRRQYPSAFSAQRSAAASSQHDSKCHENACFWVPLWRGRKFGGNRYVASILETQREMALRSRQHGRRTLPATCSGRQIVASSSTYKSAVLPNLRRYYISATALGLCSIFNWSHTISAISVFSLSFAPREHEAVATTCTCE